MARSCLFTLSFGLAVSLKRNLKFRIIKNNNALIHKCSSMKQHEEAERSTAPQNNIDPEKLKVKIMDAGLAFVPQYGWSEKSLAYGAKSLGLSTAAHRLIQGGAPDLVHYFNFSSNLKLEDYLGELSTSNEKIDLQIFLTDALKYRLEMIIPYVSRWAEAMALMVLPTQLPLHTENILELVDIVWHYYGDKCLDLSWYSKRLSLAVAYKTAELSLVQDRSEDFMDTFSFLERRIENVIQSDDLINEVKENFQQITEFGGGAFITARNLLGLNRWLR